MRAPRALLAAAVAAALVVAASGCGVSLQTLPQLGADHKAGYDLHTTFGNVSNLAPNAQVREGDSVVGRVTSITTTAYRAHVTLRIDRTVRVPQGTTAAVEFNTPLGDEYVQLSPPANQAVEALAPGATINPPLTSNAPTVEDLLAAVAAVLYGGGLGQAHTVVTELNQILGPDQPQLRQLLSQLNTTVGSLSANDSNIDNALQAVAQISGQLDAGSSAITAAFNTLPGAAAALSADNGDLQQLLAGLNNLSPVAINVVAQSGQDLTADAHQLIPVVDQLVAAQNQFVPTMHDLTTLLQQLKRIIPNGYVQAYIGMIGVFPPGYPSQIPPFVPPPTQLIPQITSGAFLNQFLQEVLP